MNRIHFWGILSNTFIRIHNTYAPALTLLMTPIKYDGNSLSETAETPFSMVYICIIMSKVWQSTLLKLSSELYQWCHSVFRQWYHMAMKPFTRSLKMYHGMDKSCWRHEMETFSALLAICAGNLPVISEFSCTWINGWVNNNEAGYLRRHHAHYDVNVML